MVNSVGRRDSPFRMDPDVGTWGVAAVQEWLTASGLQQHAELFAENEINGEMLLTLTSDELEEELEINDEAEREALLEKLDALCSGPVEPAGNIHRVDPKFAS